MCGVVDLFEPFDANACIDLCGVEPAMTKHRLDVADIGAMF